MFGPVLKIVRALLGALALTLIGVGSHVLARMESHGGGERADWGAVKRVKSMPVIAARAGAACPLAVAAAQAGAGRVWAPVSAGAGFVRFFVVAGRGAREVAVSSTMREAERQTWPRARAGVVRLVI